MARVAKLRLVNILKVWLKEGSTEHYSHLDSKTHAVCSFLFSKLYFVNKGDATSIHCVIMDIL